MIQALLLRSSEKCSSFCFKLVQSFNKRKRKTNQFRHILKFSLEHYILMDILKSVCLKSVLMCCSDMEWIINYKTRLESTIKLENWEPKTENMHVDQKVKSKTKQYYLETKIFFGIFNWVAKILKKMEQLLAFWDVSHRGEVGSKNWMR